MDVEDKIKLLEDVMLDMRREIKRLDRQNTAISKILIEQVKPVVDIINETIKEEQELENNTGVNIYG